MIQYDHNIMYTEKSIDPYITATPPVFCIYPLGEPDAVLKQAVLRPAKMRNAKLVIETYKVKGQRGLVKLNCLNSVT